MKKKKTVLVNVDQELADIIKEMKKNSMVNRAIRNFALAFVGK